MKKTSKYIIGTIILTATLGSFCTANDFDAQVADLANSIFTQIQNDVPPPVTTGDNLSTSIVDTTAGLLGNMFTKTDTSFLLTSKALNDRLNGGIIVKNTQDAIDYLYQAKLTKFSTLATYQADAPLRRDQAAKFFSLFATQVMNKSEDSSKTCKFSDAASGDSDLQGNMVSACRLGIFKGSNGMFNPTASLTNGEALAVVIRVLYGPLDETSKEHRAKSYRQKAQSYGLTQGTVMDSIKYLDTPITRGDAARLLEAAHFIPTMKLEVGADIAYSLNTQGYLIIK